MLSEDHKTILRELAIYVTFLAGSVSSLAAPTFCELLIGGMLSGEGFLTQALLTIHYENVWSSYHHWVSHGSWHWRSLSHRLVLLVALKAPEGQIISMILDDLTLERCSENAPACRTHYQHSKKKNQCKYILGQCWVYVAIAFQRASDKVYTAVPVMAFSSPKSGNTSKLKIASAMLKSIRQTLSDKAIRLLTDCWFMNWTLMQPALELGYEVVGHIQKNRALYALPIVAFPPSSFKKRGRPRKYGVKMTPDEVEKLPETRQKKLRTLLRWMHIKMAGYALLQLLTICKNEAAVRVVKIDWRLPGTVTAGTIMQLLRLIISQLRIRGCWNRYEQKLELISENINNHTDSILSKAA